MQRFHWQADGSPGRIKAVFTSSGRVSNDRSRDLQVTTRRFVPLYHFVLLPLLLLNLLAMAYHLWQEPSMFHCVERADGVGIHPQ